MYIYIYMYTVVNSSYCIPIILFSSLPVSVSTCVYCEVWQCWCGNNTKLMKQSIIINK